MKKKCWDNAVEIIEDLKVGINTIKENSDIVRPDILKAVCNIEDIINKDKSNLKYMSEVDDSFFDVLLLIKDSVDKIVEGLQRKDDDEKEI